MKSLSELDAAENDKQQEEVGTENKKLEYNDWRFMYYSHISITGYISDTHLRIKNLITTKTRDLLEGPSSCRRRWWYQSSSQNKYNNDITNVYCANHWKK